MSAQELDALCAAALKRINDYIARVAAQQARRMRERWGRR